ncbi:hypothetical protein V6N12_031473 [Hibiscus sabdariffa]|uniref:Uncharacterized protein n=1 Tax=Hibiscus sabdariffa TaxID=183260 RepID=A0ABR2CPD0_9ROSI
MAEEAIGIIERDDELRCTAMDLSAECEFSGARSDFLHKKKVILREAEETVQLGKLLGAAPKGKEKVVIQDIARIIKALVLVGRWGVEDWRCGIIGLYAPCAVTEQREFWEKVVSIILEKNVAWCVGVAALSDVPLQGNLFYLVLIWE